MAVFARRPKKVPVRRGSTVCSQTNTTCNAKWHKVRRPFNFMQLSIVVVPHITQRKLLRNLVLRALFPGFKTREKRPGDEVDCCGGDRGYTVTKGYSVTSNGSQIISVMRDLLFSQRFRLFCSYLYFAFYPTWLPRDSKFAANKTALFFGTSPEPWAKGKGYGKVKKLRK